MTIPDTIVATVVAILIVEILSVATFAAVLAYFLYKDKWR